MPFLRFSKDRRGYENTYLLHASRRRNDKDRPALLYWFRTPPHVKVGRAAFDETAIRALEDQHPGVEFDWPRILATRPPAEVPEPERPRRPGSETRRTVRHANAGAAAGCRGAACKVERAEPVEEPDGPEVRRLNRPRRPQRQSRQRTSSNRRPGRHASSSGCSTM